MSSSASLADPFEQWYESRNIPTGAIYRTAGFLDWRDDNGLRPLHIAIDDENQLATSKLLQMGHSMDDEVPSMCCATPFLLAIGRGRLDFVKWLQREIILAEYNDEYQTRPLYLRCTSKGTTPLMFAAVGQHLDVAKWILALSGPTSLSAAQLDGRTVAMHAAIDGDLETLKWILLESSDEDLLKRDKDNRSILPYAASNPNWRVLQSVLNRVDGKLSVKTLHDRSTIIMHAIVYGRLGVLDFLSTQLNKSEMIGTIINGQPAPLFAATRGKLDVLRWYCSKWACVLDVVNSYNGSTAFTCAARGGSVDLMEWMVMECRINPVGTGRFRSEALVAAAEGNHKDAVLWLIQHGCSFGDDSVAFVAVMGAVTNGHLAMVTWLFHYDNHCRSVIEKQIHQFALSVAKTGGLDTLKWFRSKNLIDPRDAYHLGYNAAVFDCVPIVSWLATEFDYDKWSAGTLVHESFVDTIVSFPDPPVAVIGWLLSNVHITKGEKLNYTFIAAENGSVELLRCLHRHGVSIQARHFKGRTLLFHAAVKGRLAIVKWLVKHGCPVMARDDDGRTALELAIAWQKTEVVRFLTGLVDGTIPDHSENDVYNILG
jgi:ankyrin repeat protein